MSPLRSLESRSPLVRISLHLLYREQDSVYLKKPKGKGPMDTTSTSATTPANGSHAKAWREGSKPEVGNWREKAGLAQMLKGGVIMDVVTPDQAKIAEDAGAVSVMALERVPSDIRKDGGVARMSDPDLIDGIINAVSIPVMAKARIGHFVEAQVLEALGVDYCDESEVLTPADNAFHVNKWDFKMPFVCGAS